MKKILIVDDNRNNRLFLSALLDDFTEENPEFTFEISEAENGRDAVDAASATKFDLILMDIMMPEMDGIEATGLIRANDKNAMIIAVSAADDEERKKQILNNGAEDYIAKPVNADIFQTRLINYFSLIDARSHKRYSSKAVNLYSSEVYSRQLTFFIESEDSISEFWEYYLLSDNIKSDLMSDVVRTIAAIAEYFVRLQIATTITAEESEDMIYLTIDQTDSLDNKLIELTMMKNSAVTDYKLDTDRMSFVIPKPEEVFEIEEPVSKPVSVPQPAPTAVPEPETFITAAPAAADVEITRSADTPLQVFDYMDIDDLDSVETYIGKLDSLFLLVGSSDISEDEVTEIFTYLERIGRVLRTYTESYDMGQSLNDLSADIANHIEDFRNNSMALGPLCAAFSRDLSKWLLMTFKEGSPTVDYMDSSVITNAQTIAGMLKMNDDAGGESDLDDIFDF
jgi:CheY-like chemotaxis protein